jgi:hypothetical protein
LEDAANWKETAAKIFANPLAAPPGSKFQYSNENFLGESPMRLVAAVSAALAGFNPRVVTKPKAAKL